MSEAPEERLLFREAADLAIRLQNDPANPVRARHGSRLVRPQPQACRGLGARRADPRHDRQDPRDQRKTAAGHGGLTRRMVILGGMIGLGAAAAGTWLGPQAIRHARADASTSTAEIRRVVLADGA